MIDYEYITTHRRLVRRWVTCIYLYVTLLYVTLSLIAFALSLITLYLSSSLSVPIYIAYYITGDIPPAVAGCRCRASISLDLTLPLLPWYYRCSYTYWLLVVVVLRLTYKSYKGRC
jgi:hypothetical protein